MNKLLEIARILGVHAVKGTVGGHPDHVILSQNIPNLAMGTAFPLAVASVDRKLVSSAFLWNGVASVLAAPLAVMLAMDVGFRSTLLLGAVCYAMAAPALVNARR